MNERSLRMTGLVRSMLIAYGVAAFSWLFSRTLPMEEAGGSNPLSALQGIGIGLALQIALVIVRTIVKRHERSHGMEGQLYPRAMYVLELLADGITVLLFAISTFRAILIIPAGI